MLLKEKLFKCGIYGKRIKIFDENEIDELLNSSWAEIITDEQHSKLKEDFHVFALEKITNRDEINDKTFVRMNTQAWNHLFSFSRFPPIARISTGNLPLIFCYQQGSQEATVWQHDLCHRIIQSKSPTQFIW